MTGLVKRLSMFLAVAFIALFAFVGCMSDDSMSDDMNDDSMEMEDEQNGDDMDDGM